MFGIDVGWGLCYWKLRKSRRKVDSFMISMCLSWCLYNSLSLSLSLSLSCFYYFSHFLSVSFYRFYSFSLSFAPSLFLSLSLSLAFTPFLSVSFYRFYSFLSFSLSLSFSLLSLLLTHTYTWKRLMFVHFMLHPTVPLSHKRFFFLSLFLSFVRAPRMV